MSNAFLLAVSKDTLKDVCEEVQFWHIQLYTAMERAELACWINPGHQGWMTYQGGSTGPDSTST